VRVLCVAAHPDDEVLGCGGTMARHSLRGDAVHVAILGEGATSRDAGYGDDVSDEVDLLTRQSHEVAELLGVERVFRSWLPDN